MQAPTTSPDQSGSSRHRLSDSNEFSSDRRRTSRQSYEHQRDGAERDQRLAKALGWFSIGLGVAQLLAPRAMSRATGVSEHPILMRAIGVREIASGVGILNERKPTEWMWTRVAGDAMDLALLGMAAGTPGTQRNRVAMATAAVAGVTALDVLSSVRQTQRNSAGQTGAARGEVDVEKSITVNRSADECYAFWHNFENFPRFMKHLEEVHVISDQRIHWKAKGPAGSSVEWDAEITNDQPGQLLAWRSVGGDVDNAGAVRFERAPGGRGTVVRVEMQYRPPGGVAGALIAKMFGEEPAQQIDEDLRRFKWLIETGEIPTTVGQPSGPRDAITRLLFRKGAPG
jgi:uncharacterized membrane protein